MKPITALLLLSLASVSAACSATSSATAEAAPASEEVIQVAESEGDVQGTFNLNVGPGGTEPARPIVGANSSAGQSGLIVAPGQTGGNFEGVADLGIDIETAPEAALEPAAPSSEDDIVRLPPSE